VNDPLDRIAREEYLYEYWQKALKIARTRPLCRFHAVTVPTQARVVKPVYRRFRTVVLELPF